MQKQYYYFLRIIPFQHIIKSFSAPMQKKFWRGKKFFNFEVG